MKKFVLKVYPNRCWHLADLEVYKDNQLVKTYYVNKFWSVNEDWFFIYDEIGGTGTGWRKGDIMSKIYIGDSEFETIDRWNR